ncbi:DUF397 domain-containing protein [Nonomuraea rhizosphaerae]|uniref:DUF397 domain-containing protein n=1 Tax=Nonomuraea rhizosphaerae TaxID=2665663 RepID=UPI001C5D86BB|nr:DUF397 domain-containing protein [Nonomuraea rhizosphaerae]
MPNPSNIETDIQWRTSSRCNNGNCVEVARISDNTIGVRDNKVQNGPVLTFTIAEWRKFVNRLQGGE